MVSLIDYEINKLVERTMQCRESAAKVFIEWARLPESGISCDNVDLKYCNETQGFGIFAKKKILSNQNILSVCFCIF